MAAAPGPPSRGAAVALGLERRLVGELVTPAGGVLPPRLAGLRLGELEAEADLIGLDLGDRALLALGGLPAPLTKPADHDHAGALADALGQVVREAPPSGAPEERRLPVAPLGVDLTSGSAARLPTMVTWVSAMRVPSSRLVRPNCTGSTAHRRSQSCDWPRFLPAVGPSSSPT